MSQRSIVIARPWRRHRQRVAREVGRPPGRARAGPPTDVEPQGEVPIDLGRGRHLEGAVAGAQLLDEDRLGADELEVTDEAADRQHQLVACAAIGQTRS